MNYVATTDRLGALYLALGPYVGNKGAGGAPAPSKKNRGRRGSLDNGTASVVTPAAMHAQAVAEQLMAQESTVPAMSALDCAGADAERLAKVGMDAAELARFGQLSQQWAKSISTFRRIDLRDCVLSEVDGRRFSLEGAQGTVAAA